MAENPMRPKMKAPRPSLLQFILPYIIILGLIIFLIFGLNGFAQANVKDFTFVSLINTLETINPNDVVQIIVAQRETVIDISGSILEKGVT
jgi:flagellar biogenesis protein FliO